MNASSLNLLGIFRKLEPMKTARRLLNRHRRRPEHTPPGESRAAEILRRRLQEEPATFERARRLAARAERLNREGTPSESACNRAARALAEVSEELRSLRAAFEAEGGSPEVFDRIVRRLLPDLPDDGRQPYSPEVT
ncbi:hypothetical protein E0L93_09795 [Rubrobacter taiwanensis]|uniref:Uncharacterized protein n=1 Tax=Rubrobacter taiwanensis TaxID=185139 RepID=A0A4R1BGS7_9ACTN|nr:hypothetical protein [Rubrobacter taiwanensis]TCJ16410.1 hypothetical protein E0L93_09795 [Rubrobacter taiwanensis]